MMVKDRKITDTQLLTKNNGKNIRYTVTILRIQIGSDIDSIRDTIFLVIKCTRHSKNKWEISSR